jgi:bifunctional DNA-binding transcriptional regulator/antitoxin component of YhaV-PrlF toxin-antitoxin module
MIPKGVREGPESEPDDRLLVEYDEERQEMRVAKAEHPIDALVEHALAEWKAGRTRNLREFAAENDIALAEGL